jgi:hypothetical protein
MSRIPVVTNLSIDKFSGGVVTEVASSTTNAVFGTYSDGRVYATQRPSINIFEDASATVADTQGRGIYYWNKVGARYFVNKDTVYKGSYAAPLAATMTAGTDKVYFFEVGDYLVILDPENNQGWTISSGASTTLVEITDVAFPPKQTPALQLAKGGVSLNGTLYAGATNGEIWSSSVEDPTTWNILNFINAEISPDSLVMIDKHNDHVAAYGTKSLEFFYDNANPTGSPLNVRNDISHNIGTIDFDTTWSDGKNVYFVSLNPSGDFNVMQMNGFAVQKVSNDDVDTFITSSVITDSLSMAGSGFTSGGRAFYCLTIYYESSSVITPLTTLVLDSSAGTWGFWELAYADINEFPIVGWTRSTATRAGDGILSNGDIVTVGDDKTPQDSIEAQIYVEAGYVDPGYISDTAASGDNIEMEIVTGVNDFGMRTYKHMDNLRIATTPTVASQNITVQHSDGGNNNYNTGRTIDLSNENNKLTRLGRFRTRNFKLTYAGSEQVEIEGIEADVDG